MNQYGEGLKDVTFIGSGPPAPTKGDIPLVTNGAVIVLRPYRDLALTDKPNQASMHDSPKVY